VLAEFGYGLTAANSFCAIKALLEALGPEFITGGGGSGLYLLWRYRRPSKIYRFSRHVCVESCS